MRTIKTIFIGLILLSVNSLTGQGIRDAIRLSQPEYLSTARVAGMGGAYGAMGADFGSILYNPASVSVYRSGEFSLGFSTNKTQTDAELRNGNRGIVEKDSKRRLKIENAGFVFHSKPAGTAWSTSNFSFGISRTANFDQHMYYEGTNKGSYTDRFLEKANGLDVNSLNPFETLLAYDTYAIDGPDNQNEYFADYRQGDELSKSESIISRGGMYEMNFAYGANYKEKVLFGFSVGVPFVNYNEEKSYVEEATDNTSVLRKLEYNQNLSTSGVGLNFKAGVIGVLNKMFRVGVAVHSPTYYTLSDDYYTDMYYERNDSGTEIYDLESPYGNFDYKYTTPWRFLGSFGSIFKFGDLGLMVDLEAEYTDYTTGKFNFTAYSTAFGDEQHQNDENQNIRNTLKPAITYRVGSELSYKKWRARGGYILPDTPYEKDSGFDSTPGYSFGVGFREWHYFIDLAYIAQANSYGYYPYQIDNEQLEQFVGVDKRISKWVLTFARKF